MKLGLFYTLKCNAACKMCCFCCSPEQVEKMDLKDALGYIRQAAGDKKFKEISISGGEALLYQEEVEEIIALSRSYNFITGLTTNGFWAKSIEDAFRVLSILKNTGLSKLTISTDEFHAAYISLQNIENLLIANEKVKLPLIFQSIITKKTVMEHPFEKKYPEYKWITGICQPIGKAKQSIPLEEYIYQGYGGKCTAADMLTIMPDGSAYPCCGQGLCLKSIILGSAKEQSFEELLKAREQNEYINVLTNLGPLILKEKGEAQGICLSNPQSEYVSMCHLCHAMGEDPVYMDKMKNLISETAYRIKYAKLLQDK